MVTGGGGGPVNPIEQETRIRKPSEDGPRRRRISILRGNERDDLGKEERGEGDNKKRGRSRTGQQ